MALLQNEKPISLADVGTGQVLKIIYEGKESLILVVEPNATTVVDTSQGRVGKLHAIKLRSLSEYDMFQLIKFIRSLKTANPRLIYDEFKLTPYSEGRRNYRTYSPEKITKISRVTIGQVSKGTSKLIVGNSILYGVNHGNYVEVSINQYPIIIDEIKSRNYKIFYEGIESAVPEPIVLELFDILETFDETFDKSQLKFESWDINMQTGIDELTTILPLFGPGFNDFTENIQKGIVESIEGKTLLDVLEMSARNGGWISKTADTENIKKVVAMAPSNISSKLNGYLNSEYSEKNLKDFHTLGQQYAFADFEGLEIPKDTEIVKTQQRANRMRDVRLKSFMEKTVGVYFAGSGHIRLVKKLL